LFDYSQHTQNPECTKGYFKVDPTNDFVYYIDSWNKDASKWVKSNALENHANNILNVNKKTL
jgi:hypothetical protein